jgi:Zn-finger nucleic acid-binding protein
MNHTRTFPCPSCKTPLEEMKLHPGAVLNCPACKGKCVRIGILKSVSGASYSEKIWNETRKARSAGTKPCPVCTQAMKVIQAPSRGSVLELDSCGDCLMVWFDPSELERIPRGPMNATGGSGRHSFPAEKTLSAESGSLSDFIEDFLFVLNEK